MEQLLGFALPGVRYGCTYALVAVCLVLTYQATGVFNFAFGAQAFKEAVYREVTEEVSIQGEFEGDLPAAVWRFQKSRRRSLPDPGPETLLTPTESTFECSFSSLETEARWAYGIAWRW